MSRNITVEDSETSLIFPSTIIVGLSESEARTMYSAVMEEFAKFVEQVPGVKVLWDDGCEKWDVVDVEVVGEEYEPTLDETHAVYWCVACQRDVNAEHFDDHEEPEPEYDGPDEYDVRDADEQAIIAGNRWEAGGCR